MLFIEERNILALNRAMDAPVTGLALTYTKDSEELLNVARRERQKGNRIQYVRFLIGCAEPYDDGLW